MPSIYVQAAIVAAAGLAIAGVDYALRPNTVAPAAPGGPNPPKPKPADTPKPPPQDVNQGKTTPPVTPNGGAPTGPTAAATSAAKEIPHLDVAKLGPEISLDEAYTLYLHASAFFVDVRSPEDFAGGHIRDARNLPVNDLLEGKANTIAFLQLYSDKTQPLVIYCGGGDCHDSHNAVGALRNLGYTALHVFKDGFPGWAQAKLASDTGADPGF